MDRREKCGLASDMAQCQVVDNFNIGSDGAEICLIERIVPGKAPSCVQFKGSWANADIEAERLNAEAHVGRIVKIGRKA
jgi:hypothetical protein